MFLFKAKQMDKSGLPVASTGPELGVTSSWRLVQQKAMKIPVSSGKRLILHTGKFMLQIKQIKKYF